MAITRLNRVGRSTQITLAFAEQLRCRGAGLRVLNLGGGDVDTHIPVGSMVFTDSQICNALRLIESGEPAIQVARGLGMSRVTLYRRIRELSSVTA